MLPTNTDKLYEEGRGVAQASLRTRPHPIEMQAMDVTTLIFAALAIFVVWKLRSVLGTRTGAEKPPFDPARRQPAPTSDGSNVVRLPGAANDRGTPLPADRWKGVAELGTPLAANLDAIAAADPGFTGASFLSGARAAYEMIVTAFAAGDRKTLSPLLAKDVMDSFDAAITAREQAGEKVDTTFVSIDKAAVEDAQVRGGAAQIAVRFQSKLITATRDAAGKIVEGDPEKVTDVVDIWTFARDPKSRDPHWKLVATETVH